MPRNWGPRQIVFRRFLQLHDTLDKAFAYVEDVCTFHRDRPECADLVAYADELKTLLAQVDRCVDILETRFKRGLWPSEITHESGKPVDSEGNPAPLP
jgi:hypothetical protein